MSARDGMTAGEIAVWAAVYAAYVRNPTMSSGWEQPTDASTARAAAKSARRAVEALRDFAEQGPSDDDDREMAREVIA